MTTVTTKETVRIGLISDTHMPERCFTFPDNLPQVFDGVDFILHAGDVGELWVLDKLSEIAPVFAVHGNDDTIDAQRELPLQQLITIAGRRMLLWHNHYPDPIDEYFECMVECNEGDRTCALECRSLLE